MISFIKSCIFETEGILETMDNLQIYTHVLEIKPLATTVDKYRLLDVKVTSRTVMIAVFVNIFLLFR